MLKNYRSANILDHFPLSTISLPVVYESVLNKELSTAVIPECIGGGGAPMGGSENGDIFGMGAAIGGSEF